MLPKNTHPARSPDLREIEDISQHFAVNQALFLRDPEYPCRRPALSLFFARHLGVKPDWHCQMNTRIPVYSYENKNGFKMIDLDPARIYQVRYLPALPGNHIAELWGHAMIELVICSPDRKEVGPECLKDTSYHLTVAYDPEYPDTYPEVWKSISGQYPSHVFMNVAPALVKYYNRREFRDVQSFPLKLTQEEKTLLTYQILSQYWEFQNDYYFFTDNCTTEIVHLLEGVLDSKETTKNLNNRLDNKLNNKLNNKLKRIAAQTPLQVVDELDRLGYLDKTILEPRDEAIRNGYIFPGKLEKLEAAYARLRRTHPALRWKSLNDYTNHSTAAERKALINSDPNDLADLGTLEKQIQTMKWAELDDAISSGLRTEKRDLLERSQAARAKTVPMKLVKGGYGIPTAKEMAPGSLAIPFTELKKVETEIFKWARNRFKSLYQETEEIDRNLFLFQSRDED